MTTKHYLRASAELTAELDTLLNTEADTLGGSSVRTGARRADGAAREVFAQFTALQASHDELVAALQKAVGCLEYHYSSEFRQTVDEARTAIAQAWLQLCDAQATKEATKE